MTFFHGFGLRYRIARWHPAVKILIHLGMHTRPSSVRSDLQHLVNELKLTAFSLVAEDRSS